MQRTSSTPRCTPATGWRPRLAQFVSAARALRERRLLVSATIAASLLVGTIYYFVAPRTYRAQAALLITRERDDLSSSTSALPQRLDHRISTYVAMFRSTVVVDGALKRVQELPPDARVDFIDTPRDDWGGILASRMAVNIAGDADVIEVACESQNAEAARLLVEAVVSSFNDYVKLRHKEHSRELLATLQRERLSIEQRILQKRKALAAARDRAKPAALKLALPQLHNNVTDVQLAELDLQRWSTAQASLAERILDLEIHQLRPPVRFDMISPARTERQPTWPKLSLILLAATGVGLAFGLTLAAVLDLLDDRFRSPEELRSQTGAPLLATVGALAVCDGVGLSALQAHAAPAEPASEAFRSLRAMLGCASGRHVRVAVSSPRAGDGKTTVLANLGVACARAGLRTLLVDADLRRGGLTKLLQRRTQIGLSEFLDSDEPPGDAVKFSVHATGIAQLDIVPRGQGDALTHELLAYGRMADLLTWAAEKYACVLIDTPPLLAVSDTLVVGRQCDGVVLIMQPDVSRRHDVLRAIEQLSDSGVTLAGLVANRVNEHGRFGGRSEYVYAEAEAVAEGAACDLHDMLTESHFDHEMPAPQMPSAPSDALRPRRVA